jgi:hypothetical protein
MTELTDCKAGCFATLSAARDNCRSLYATGTKELDQCIDQAQVVAFSCRDQCREDVRPALAECRNTFRSCITLCPTPESE